MPPRVITIDVAYPGASPVEMEDGVTIKIEQALEGLSGIKDSAVLRKSPHRAKRTVPV